MLFRSIAKKKPVKRSTTRSTESNKIRAKVKKDGFIMPHGYEVSKAKRGVSGVKKSPARSMHKDTKSHNVSIRVMSGVNSKLNELKQMKLKLKEAQSIYKKERDSLIKMYINAHRISPLKYNIKKLETELKTVKRELNKIK